MSRSANPDVGQKTVNAFGREVAHEHLQHAQCNIIDGENSDFILSAEGEPEWASAFKDYCASFKVASDKLPTIKMDLLPGKGLALVGMREVLLTDGSHEQ